jgi:hypothetical protein
LQWSALRDYRNRWHGLRQSTIPLVTSKTEEAVRALYRSAGFKAPAIVWCGGPISIARSVAAPSSKLRPGSNVRTALVDRLLDRASSMVRKTIGLPAWVSVVDELQIKAPDPIGATVRNAVLRRARNVIVEDIGAMRGKLSVLQWGRTIFRGMNFLGRSYNQHEIAWCSAYAFFREVVGLVKETEPVAGLIELSENVGWILPHRYVCWVGGRPDILSINPQHRVHSASGPALRYADGTSFYFWKDIEVEKWLIKEPEKITVRRIDEEPDSRIRRCMIDIMTPAQFIASGRPICASWDETGILWRKSWTWGDTWAAVEVINGSPEADGSRKHYFLQVPPDLRTAREAVAWTYGMSPGEYARLSVRT